MAISTYSPMDVTITLGGLHSVIGYADGTFVTIKKDIKPFAKVRAMDGEIARQYFDDAGYKVELTLMQSSPTNNVLSMLYNVDTVTHMGKVPLFIKDSRGQTTFIAGTAWIEEIPTVTFSSQLDTRTWVFGCADVAMTIGGNGDTTELEDSLLLGSSSLPLLKNFGVF
ncbi:virion structural protein [Pseudomonas phage vB_PpuM-NoPa]|uniref:Virion structural protein n=4 Tax=Tartuvirus TaxID=3424912 RepID=A0AAX4MWQ2_9CAUD